MSQKNSLMGEIRAAEKHLNNLKQAASRHPRTQMTARDAILAEIDQVEARIGCGEGMGFDAPAPVMEEEVVSVPMSYMDMEMEDEMDYMDDEMEFMEMEDEMGYMHASEDDASGAEEDITQDYLSDVVDLMGEGNLATEPSMEQAARAAGMSSTDYLKRASVRLDRVSTYLEKNGQVKVAYRLDKMADAIDNRIKQQEAN